MASIKIEGAIVLPDGSTTGHFVFNIPLLPPVARHVSPAAEPLEPAVEHPPSQSNQNGVQHARGADEHHPRHRNRH